MESESNQNRFSSFDSITTSRNGGTLLEIQFCLFICCLFKSYLSSNLFTYVFVVVSGNTKKERRTSFIQYSAYSILYVYGCIIWAWDIIPMFLLVLFWFWLTRAFFECQTGMNINKPINHLVRNSTKKMYFVLKDECCICATKFDCGVLF